jgi:hypothetical protein
MSPRSKENLIKKIKVEHMLWKVDNVLEERDVGHRIIEKAEMNDHERN